MKENNNNSNFPGWLEITFAVLFALKLAGLTDVSWWIVFSPVIGGLAAMLVLAALMLVGIGMDEK